MRSSGVYKGEFIPPSHNMPRRRQRTQEGEGLGDIIKRVRDIWGGVRKIASPAVRRFTEQNGDAKITSIVVCRKPIVPAIERLASVVSGGRWDTNKKNLQYDSMFHLFLVMSLDNGRTIKLEKNHVVEISTNTATGQDVVNAPAPRSITWRDMLAAAERAAGGAEKLWVYDAVTQNCQWFAKWQLECRAGEVRHAERCQSHRRHAMVR